MSSEVHESKRQSIISAATQLFLEYGSIHVSMDKIALAAPVSKATLYNHFENKNALLTAVIAQFCEGLLTTMNQAVTTIDSVENNLYKIATAFVAFIFREDALALYRLVIAESHAFPELGQRVYDSSAQAVLQCLEAYLKQLNQQSPFAAIEPAFAADAFFSLLKGDWHFQCLLGIKPLPTEVEKQQLVEKAVAFYLQGLTSCH